MDAIETSDFTRLVCIFFILYRVSRIQLLRDKLRNVWELLWVLIRIKWHTRTLKKRDKKWSYVDSVEDKLDRDPVSGKDVLFVSVEDGKEWTRLELECFANQVAHWLTGQGVAQGQVVALMLTNCAEYVGFWLGVAKLGASTALLNTNLVGDGLAHCVRTALCNPRDETLRKDTNASREGGQSAPKILVVEDCFRSEVEASLKADATLRKAVRVVYWGDLLVALDAIRAAPRPPREWRSEVRETDPILYIFSSGTTGLPKACNISQSRFFAAGLPVATMTYLRPGVNMYSLGLPLYHSAAGMLGVGAVLDTGATMVLRKKFSARAFADDCTKFNVSVIQYIGELARYLVSAPVSASEQKLRLNHAIGNGLAKDVWPVFKQRFNVKYIAEFYGATEGNVALFNTAGREGALGYIPRVVDFMYPVKLLRVDPDDPSVPLRNGKGFCELAAPGEPGLVSNAINNNTNEVQGRFEGYRGGGGKSAKENNDKKILKDVLRKGDLYFNSGDLLTRDAEGFFYFGDRVGDTFRWKGENVSTLQVEQALAGTSGVSEVCVYGVSVPGRDGKAGMACIVLSPEQGGRVPWQALSKAAEKLEKYARPIFVRVTDAIPVTSTFKYLKSRLAREGIDPAVCSDPVYLVDKTHPEGCAYVSGSVYQAICDGEYNAKL